MHTFLVLETPFFSLPGDEGEMKEELADDDQS
jgi:hypothetical protein